MDLKKSLGYQLDSQPSARAYHKLILYINLKLAALGQPVFVYEEDSEFLDLASALIKNHQEKNRLLSDYLCPADRRVQDFLDNYLKDCKGLDGIKIPASTFILDSYGLARNLSLPANRDSFSNRYVKSYRIKQGVLHNPKNDRRTTKGAFHIVDGGLPVPDDKYLVPKQVFANILRIAFSPPTNLLRVPFTAGQGEQAELFVSLLLRPVVCPEVTGFTNEKTTEIRFFAPGSLVSNLDFVESIFGNAGDPYLPENDAGLDVEHWTGHTGFVILAPHLADITKKQVGLLHWDDASERERRDSMCWRDDKELYNDGNAFKITCRDKRGIMVTIIADNYFGYCKKEVKTQISLSANLYGLAEEEHAGGAIAFPSYDLGEEFQLNEQVRQNNNTFDDVVALLGDTVDVKPEGYALDKQYPQIVYVSYDAKFSLTEKSISWTQGGSNHTLRLLHNHTYVLPSGYKVQLIKHPSSMAWRLMGTVAEGTLCHKPCTVSGGGKSEISKSIVNAMFKGPVFTADFYKDLDLVTSIINRDFGDRFKKVHKEKRISRPVLSPERSLGSVIKLFTPSVEYTDPYNDWLKTIPNDIKELIYVVKRHFKPEWANDWRSHFSVDIINGHLGHELKYHEQKIMANYLRVGMEKDGSWRTYKVRQDFMAAEKLQVEDDITASVVVPSEKLSFLNPDYENTSVKIVHNCEYRLFQRPDDAIHRGFDKQAEADIASPNSFLSNYEPLTVNDAKNLIEDAINFDQYTDEMKQLILDFYRERKNAYVAVSSHPRLINGRPCKNPRYLQDRPDLMSPRARYVLSLGARLFRRVPLEKRVLIPVNAVLPGRRNNPPDAELGIPALAVYNPIHYQELPELFMDFICSVTGKSPSTTGFGSEGALTKGPFNALLPAMDLNSALVSYILTGYDGFSSAAGFIGPKIRVDHDISLLIPEIWCRMSVEERNPRFLIDEGYLEKLSDFEHNGRNVVASRLGYRITIRFVHAFLGRVFSNPDEVFSEEMLKPEKQDKDMFVDGLHNISETQRRVAEAYFRDGSVEYAAPPLKALLHIMVSGKYEGKDLNHPDIRAMFTKKYLLKSSWYRDRLLAKQTVDIALWEKNVAYLQEFVAKESHAETSLRLKIGDRLAYAKEEFSAVSAASYLKRLQGTIGADPFLSGLHAEPLSGKDSARTGKGTSELQEVEEERGSKRST